jgi:hypothetical protein
MTRTDMSPRAVTVRLFRTAQLRRLCLELRRGRESARRAVERPTELAAATKASFQSRAK